MFRNFWKTAVRNMQRRKGFSLINIFGLSFGLTACIMIGLFVRDEMLFDKFLPDHERIYRINDEYSNAEGSQTLAVTAPVFANSLVQDFPQVEKVARVMELPANKVLFEFGNKQLYESSGYYTDSTFFDVFALSFRYGSPTGALQGKESVVISNSLSARIFGSQNPLGRQLLIDKKPYLVRAVFLENPKFHLRFDYLMPLAALPIPSERMQSWEWHQFFTYVKLRPGINVDALQVKFQQYVKLHSRAHEGGVTAVDRPIFQALGKIHLYSASLKFDAALRGNIRYVNGLVLIAIFILLIACFNFINLATANSLQRAKEVGIRKSVGAVKSQLVLQFLGESLFLSFISLVLAVLMACLLLPSLNHFTGKSISVINLFQPLSLLFLVIIALLVGVLAGFYPAIVLSRFKPVKVLKSDISANVDRKNIPWLRHVLVITQFTLTVLLMICSVIVFDQVKFLHQKDLGFNKDQIMFFPMRSDFMLKNPDAFKNDLLRLPGVSSVSVGYGFPGDAVAGDEIIVDQRGQHTTHPATQLTVDFDYIKTLGLHIVAGRDFSKSVSTDKDHGWIINETAVREFGYKSPQDALGKYLYWHPWDGNNPDSLKTGQIIGVVKDFNYASLYDKIGGAVIQIYPQAAWKVAVKMHTTGIAKTIASVGAVWAKYSPDFPMEYQFLDENFSGMYASEEKLETLLWIFTGVAIFVGCLGMLGLSAFTAERRKKELGIRKVLGATTSGLLLLLARETIKLIFLALLIASPLGWYFMNKWLQNFAYQIDISWWIFIFAGMGTILIAAVTISFNGWKAARASPVKNLRTE